jgi:hypothetical protein
MIKKLTETKFVKIFAINLMLCEGEVGFNESVDDE